MSAIFYTMTDKGSAKPSHRLCKVCLIRGHNNDAVYFCVDCVSSLCEKCQAKHLKVVEFRDHALARITPVYETEITCEVHSSEPALYCCLDCQMALCSACAIYDHAIHDKEDLRKHLADMINHVRMLENTLIGIKAGHVHRAKVVSGMRNTLKFRCEKAEAEITSHCTKLISSITKKQQGLISLLQQTYQSKSDHITNDAAVEETAIVEITDWVDKAMRILQSTDGPTILRDLDDIKCAGESLAVRDTAPLPATEFLEFQPEDNMGLGQLTMDYCLLKQAPLWTADAGDSGDVRDIKFMSESMFALARANSVALYSIQGDPHTFQLLNETKLDGHDIDYVACDASHLYFTCHHDSYKAVHIYDVIENTPTPAEKQSLNYQFEEPTGVAVTKCGNLVISGNKDGQSIRVSVYDRNGVCLNDVDMPYDDDLDDTGSALQCPEFVSCDKDDNIIVSDWKLHNVYVFDSLGKRKLQFGGKGNQDGKFNEPRGVSSDVDGNIIVADHQNHRISQFDHDGRFMKHLLTYEFAEIYFPSGISLQVVDGHTLLAFIDDAEECAKIFQI